MRLVTCLVTGRVVGKRSPARILPCIIFAGRTRAVIGLDRIQSNPEL